MYFQHNRFDTARLFESQSEEYQATQKPGKRRAMARRAVGGKYALKAIIKYFYNIHRPYANTPSADRAKKHALHGNNCHERHTYIYEEIEENIGDISDTWQ